MTVWLSLFSAALLLINYLQYRMLNHELHERERERKAHKQTVTELIDRLMYKEGHVWTPPPKADREEEPDEEFQRFVEGWKEV